MRSRVGGRRRSPVPVSSQRSKARERRSLFTIAPLDPEIWELLKLKFNNICNRETASEKVQIERKPQTIARLGHSPNAADSVIRGFSAKAAEKPKSYSVSGYVSSNSLRGRCSALFYE